MGNHVCRCCIKSETPKQNNRKKELLSSIMDNEDKQMIRNSIKIRSSMGALSNLSSFHCCNLPPSSVENNKYFHIAPCDTNIFMEMVKSNKVKVLPMEFVETEDYFYSQLEECKNTIEHYESLINSISNLQKSDPKLLIEIISGYDINLNKGKYIPFVEITQNACTNVKCGKDISCATNSTIGTDQIESFVSNYDCYQRKSESSKSTKALEFADINLQSFSTQVPIKPNKEGVFEWSKFFKMEFWKDCHEKDKSFTISLFRTKKNKNKAEKLGQSRSFFLVHLKHQELREVNLEFKDSYESKCEGKIIFRMQYIEDEMALYSKILAENIKRRDLIHKCIEILNKQIQSHRESEQIQSELGFVEDLNRECGSHNAGFYSEYGGSSFIESNASIVQTYNKNDD